MQRKHESEAGRLRARPGAPLRSGAPGLHRLGSRDDRSGLLYVPSGRDPGEAAPMVVMFHGAGGNAQHGLAPLMPLADEEGLVLLATDSRDRTWDVILGGFGPDVETLDRALAEAFGGWAVDPARVAVGGFSDGASYALSLGITYGGLFTHVIAFSPGFVAPVAQEGAPRVFVSHGTGDRVLPVGACSRKIVPRLRDAGYEVVYREFEGGHSVPPDVAHEAVEWFLAPQAAGA